MRLVIISIIAITFYTSSSRASEDACGTRLNQHIPTFHQGTSLMCGSYSTSQVLSSMYRTPVSPIWLSLTAGTFGSIKPSDVFNTVSKEPFLCKHDASKEPSADQVTQFLKDVSTSMAELEKKIKVFLNMTPDHRLYSTLSGMATRKGFSTTEAYIEDLKKNLTDQFKSTLAEKMRNTFSFGGLYSYSTAELDEMTKKIVDQISLGSLNKYDETVQFARLGYKKYCDENKIPNKAQGKQMTVNHMIGDHPSSQCSSVQSQLDGNLSQSTPAVIGLNFSVMYNSSITNKGSGHYLAVVGKNCDGDEPKYLIRNSYGANCNRHDGESGTIAFDCDPKTGEFWVPLSKLCENVGSVFTTSATQETINGTHSEGDEN